MEAHPFAGVFVLAPAEPAPLSILNAAAARAWRAGEAIPGLDRAPRTDARAAPAPVADPAPANCLRRVYALCGSPIAVRFSPPSLEGFVAQRFDHSRDDDAEPVATMTLMRNRRGFALASPNGTLHLATETALLGAFVRRFVELSHPGTGWRAVVHAAAVACDGQAVVLAGSNGSGKSTLVAGLLSAGCGYLSDDCAPIARDGRVVPVPFALCLKSGSWATAAACLPGLEDAPVLTGPGGRRCRFVPPQGVVTGGVTPGLLVFPRYARGAATEVRALDPIETLRRLVEGRAWLSRDPDDLAATLVMIEQLPSYALDYGDLRQAVAAVLDLRAETRRTGTGRRAAAPLAG